jgi:hypothetical protein
MNSLDELASLNQVLPYWSIVRYPDAQPLGEVPLGYYHNSVDVSEFIHESFGLKEGNMPIDKADSPASCRDYDAFKEWILRCQTYMAVGKNGDRPYYGNTTKFNPMFSSLIGQLRPLTTQARLRSARDTVVSLYNIACQTKDPIARNVDNYKDLLELYKKEQYIWIYPNPSNNFDSEGIIKKCEGMSVDSVIPEELFRLPTNVMFVKGGKILYLYPDSRSIPDYLEKMRSSLSSAFTYVSQGNSNDALHSIAEFYQWGVRSQAVAVIWNSVLMSIVNEFVAAIDLPRHSHGMFDLLALGLESTFPALFTGVLNGHVEMTSSKYDQEILN